MAAPAFLGTLALLGTLLVYGLFEQFPAQGRRPLILLLDIPNQLPELLLLLSVELVGLSAKEFAFQLRKQADLFAPIDEGAISTTLVHLANISYRLGRTLHFDAATYTCKGDAEANRMFTRNYRKPFVVPEKV